jgi:predicted glutamine amidotransferase
VSFFLIYYYKDIDPSFNQQKLAQIESQMDSPSEIAQIRKSNQALENKTDQEIRTLAKQNMSLMYNPQFTLSVSLLALLVYSTLNSLLIAVIYRKIVFKD